MSHNRRSKRRGIKAANKMIRENEARTKAYLTKLLQEYCNEMDHLHHEAEDREELIKRLDVKWIDHVNRNKFIDKEKGSGVFRQEIEFINIRAKQLIENITDSPDK